MGSVGETPVFPTGTAQGLLGHLWGGELFPALRVAAMGGLILQIWAASPPAAVWASARCSGRAPGVKAQIAKAWEAPGRRAQGSGCLVAGWEGGCKQTGHNSPTPSTVMVTGSSQQPPVWQCQPRGSRPVLLHLSEPSHRGRMALLGGLGSGAEGAGVAQHLPSLPPPDPAAQRWAGRERQPPITVPHQLDPAQG